MAAVGTTITQAGSGDGWAITDEVIALRVWGSIRSDHRYSLRDAGTGDLIVGKVEECAVRLDDATGGVSKRHAVLSRKGSVWRLKDLGSKNGCFRDGERHLEFDLTAGLELEIGAVKLI